MFDGITKVSIDIPSEPNPNDTNEPLTQSNASDIAYMAPSTPQALYSVIYDEMDIDTLVGVTQHVDNHRVGGLS